MNPRILIVDDNPDNRKLIAWLLEDEGFENLVEVDTAEACLEILEQESFDLVLMDIRLPEMGGDEATRKLRADPRFADLPIIAVTAHAISGEKEAILASGVSALVTKPIDEEELLTTMRRLLEERS